MFSFSPYRMKFMLVAVLHMLLVVSLTHGAAIAAIDSAGAASSGQHNTITTAGETSSRTGRQQQQLSSNEVYTNNEPISRVLPGFVPAAFQPGNNGHYQLKTSWGNFGVSRSGVAFWGITGLLIIIGVWIFSLFSGFEFIKPILTGFPTFKGRAEEMGFKLDKERINMVANQVYKAIDTWREKNKIQ